MKRSISHEEKKRARRQRRKLKKLRRICSFRKRQRGFLIFVLTLVAVVVAFMIATTIVDLVFSNEKIVIGERAESVLTYGKPASKILRKLGLSNLSFGIDKDYDIFQQAALPIGNGDMGLSILGETNKEKLIFNEKTLWSGGPKNGESGYNGDNFTGVGADGLTESERYYAVRNALLSGDNDTANRLFNNINNYPNKGAYLAWGNVVLDFGHKKTKNYSRSLNIDDAIANVSYKCGGVQYNRELFANNPSNVIAVELTSQGGDLDFTVSFDTKQNGSVVASNGGIRNFGALDNGLNYYLELRIIPNGGQLEYGDGSVRVYGSNKVDIYLSAATDYKMDFPVYRTGESAAQLEGRVVDVLNAAVEKGYDALKEEHLADYHSLYDRVAINLGGKKPNFSTDTLICRYATVYLRKSHRLYLEQLLYNFGRYLLISSSRENSQLPANLQGVWNESNSAPWESDYHININLQMNYWPAYNTNLAECATPLVKYVDGLRAPGRITAKTYTASPEELAAGLSDEEYGFIANTEGNPYGHTAPGSGEYAKALWSPVAVAWLIQNLYEGYEYSLSLEYLSQIYPIMKEALRYFERTMVMYNGRLVTGPSYSPEHGPLTMGNTYEQSLIWQLLTDSITAATRLNTDADKVAQWSDMLSKLHPIEIGKGGQIKEWYNETYNWSMGEPLHRHTSHLLGLFPGDLINKDTHPDWLKAARTSLKWRGKNTTGWAMGQRINTYARLGDGNNAYSMIQKLFKRGIYSNLFDAHPPFQIDGNFGYTAGVTEMLMQSNLGYIELLPALPDAWKQGEISGIVARGNFEISMRWQDKTIEYASVKSLMGEFCSVRLPNCAIYHVLDEHGSPVPFTTSDGRIQFPTTPNSTYLIVRS